MQESCHVKGIFSRSASHHVSFRPSHLDSPQEPEKDRVAPLRPIVLRRSSQWRNHQILRENIKTQGTVRSESQCSEKHTLVFSESVPQSLLRVPYIPERFSLLTVTPLDTWLTSKCTRVTIWIPLHLSVTSTLPAIRLSYPCKEWLGTQLPWSATP